ncbi:hypothetical protein Bbelb_203730 [Branchiostoma belcheri]|nr:hypothetical protein Bbelb_203730 [Branchiostoma belcheri]
MSIRKTEISNTTFRVTRGTGPTAEYTGILHHLGPSTRVITLGTPCDTASYHTGRNTRIERNRGPVALPAGWMLGGQQQKQTSAIISPHRRLDDAEGDAFPDVVAMTTVTSSRSGSHKRTGMSAVLRFCTDAPYSAEKATLALGETAIKTLMLGLICKQDGLCTLPEQEAVWFVTRGYSRSATGEDHTRKLEL